MGSKERRRRERERHRQEILDAALAIILEEGFAGLSMRKLADRIEYSPASIYLYFEGREQIARGLREMGFSALLTLMEESIVDVRGREALHAMANAYVAFGTTRPELYRLIFMSDAGFMRVAYAGEETGDAADRAYALLLQVVRGLEGAPKAKKAATALADVVWASLHGIVSLHLASSGLQATPPEAQGRLSVDLIAKGLMKRTERE